MAIIHEHLKGIHEWASGPLRGGTGFIMTLTQAHLVSSPKVWNGLYTNRGMEEANKFKEE